MEGKCAKFRLSEGKKEKGAQKNALPSRLHLIRRRRTWAVPGGGGGTSGPVLKPIIKASELCEPP